MQEQSCGRPPWTAEVPQMQEQFAASRTLRYVNAVTPFTGAANVGEDTVKQVSEILAPDGFPPELARPRAGLFFWSGVRLGELPDRRAETATLRDRGTPQRVLR